MSPSDFFAKLTFQNFLVMPHQSRHRRQNVVAQPGYDIFNTVSITLHKSTLM